MRPEKNNLNRNSISNMVYSLIFLIVGVATASYQKINTNESTQDANKRPIVLYDDAISLDGLEKLVKLGVQPRYMIIYQNECDTGAQKTGIIDPNKIIEYIIKQWGADPEGWGVLDFEEPFDIWIQKGVDTQECKLATVTMINAIKVLKKRFPKVKWSYYGIPGLAYYMNGQTWSTASEDSKNNEIKKQLAQYGPVMDECDWLGPCIYNMVGDGKDGIRPMPNLRSATRAYTFARTKICVDFIKLRNKSTPVIPFASPLFMPGGGSRAFSVIPQDIMIGDTLEPAYLAGANGITIWTCGTYFIGLATGVRISEDFKEAGGTKALIRRWSEDLKIKPEDMKLPDTQIVLKNLIADSVVLMAAETYKVWLYSNKN